MNYVRSGSSLTARVQKLMNQFLFIFPFRLWRLRQRKEMHAGLNGGMERKRPLEELRADGSKYYSKFQKNVTDFHALDSCY